jgi:hypothetical protein
VYFMSAFMSLLEDEVGEACSPNGGKEKCV